MIFGQVMIFFKVDPDPDLHFIFLCEHGARVLTHAIVWGDNDDVPLVCQYLSVHDWSGPSATQKISSVYVEYDGLVGIRLCLEWGKDVQVETVL